VLLQLFALLSAVYLVYPFLSYAWLLRDPEPANQLDAPSIRRSIARQIEARLRRTEGPSSPLLTRMIQEITSEAMIEELIRGCGELPALPSVSVGPRPGRDAREATSARCSSELEWMFFTSWNQFEVQTAETLIRMQLQGSTWKVVDLQLRRLSAEPTRSENLP